MRKFAFAGAAFITALIFLAFTFRQHENYQPAFDWKDYKTKAIVRCSPDWTRLSAWLDSADIPPMPGAGNYQWKISTKNDSAQFYFNQGINMYYGFHIIEALASFKKAARLDAESPMVWWAQALAYGPNINDMEYNASPEAVTSIVKAESLIEKATPVEKVLIHAMSVRYSDDSAQTRKKLNDAYAEAMKAAFEKYPASADVAALYAEALMLQHPWDFWNWDGSPKFWTPPIRNLLEETIARAPLHPGANHYYIHVMEASPYAAKALPIADRLGRLSPGLSHMVHMPAHIYLRTGQFNKGTEINENAISQYTQYSALFPGVTNGFFLYQLHNQHMIVNCAMLAGRAGYAGKKAIELQQIIDTSFLSLPAPLGTGVQYLYMAPVFVNIRFAKWDSLLLMPPPSSSHVYAALLFHFGRGMAYANKGETDLAIKESDSLQQLLNNEDLKIPIKPFSPPSEGAKTANEILQGTIALGKKEVAAAILHYTAAVQIEQQMIYNEPRDWLLSPKQYLGEAYLYAHQWQKAAVVFESDLKVNNNNVFSLYGLQKALEKQNKKSEAVKVKERFATAAKESDLAVESLFP